MSAVCSSSLLTAEVVDCLGAIALQAKHDSFGESMQPLVELSYVGMKFWTPSVPRITISKSFDWWEILGGRSLVQTMSRSQASESSSR